MVPFPSAEPVNHFWSWLSCHVSDKLATNSRQFEDDLNAVTISLLFSQSAYLVSRVCIQNRSTGFRKSVPGEIRAWSCAKNNERGSSRLFRCRHGYLPVFQKASKSVISATTDSGKRLKAVPPLSRKLAYYFHELWLSEEIWQQSFLTSVLALL